jgi:tetratricopeptide (TPR) repeat protein
MGIGWSGMLQRRLTVRTVPIALSVGLLLVFSAPAAAQPQNQDQLDEAARLLFESAREAFAAGDYELALGRFQQAYAASPRPALLYNIATTLDRLRRDEEALAALERFLAADPNTPNRSEIESRMRVLRTAVDARQQQQTQQNQQNQQNQQQIDQQRQQIDQQHQQQQDPHVDDGGGLPPLVFIAGAALTAIAAGLVVWSGLDTSSLNDDYETFAMAPGADFAGAKAHFDDAHAAQARTNILIGVAGAVAAGTVVLAILTDWGGGDEEPPAPEPPATAPEASARIRPFAAVGIDGLLLGASGEL